MASGGNALVDGGRAGNNAGASGGARGFWTWEQFGLILVPAAWMLISMVPNCMTLAYAYLPHAHRVQTGAVRHALRAHSYLLFFVSLAMVQAAFLHGVSSAAHGAHHLAAGGGSHHGAPTLTTPLSAGVHRPPSFATRSEAEAWEQQTHWQQAMAEQREETP